MTTGMTSDPAPPPARAPLRFVRLDYAGFSGMFCYAAASLAVPMTLVAIGETLGFPIAEDGSKTLGGLLHLGRTLAMIPAMLLCGVLAAWWGIARTLAGAIALMGTGIAMAATAPSYGWLLAGIVLAGLGEGVLEGLLTPFVQELHPDEPGRYLNFTHSFWAVGTLVTVLTLGGFLEARVSWRYLLGATAVLSLLPLSLLLWPSPRRRNGRDGGASLSSRVRRPAGSGESPRAVALRVGRRTREILARPHFWLFFAAMFFAGGGEFGLTFWIPAIIKSVFNGTDWQCGVSTACFAGGMVAGRMGWGYFVRQSQLARLVIGSGLAATALGIALCLPDPGSVSLWAIDGLLLLTGIAAAPFWPSIQSYASDRLPELDMTMLFVLLSCAGIPGCGVITWLMGVAGDRWGLHGALILVPASFLIMTALIALDWRRAPKPE